MFLGNILIVHLINFPCIPPDATLLLTKVVIDPPFVQEACWRAYSKTANLLLRESPLTAAAMRQEEEEEKVKVNETVSSNSGTVGHSSGVATLPSEAVAPPVEPANVSAANSIEVLLNSVVEEGVNTVSIAEEVKAVAQVPKGRTGLVLLTTILENAPLLEELFGVRPNKFRPSVPNLVYQYHIFTNYKSTGLSEVNPEVGE